MRSIICLLCAFCLYPLITNSYIHQTPGGLYTAKIPGKSLYLVMERITNKNKHHWATYLENQRTLRTKGEFKNPGGVIGAITALKDCPPDNEQWIAYITSNPDLQTDSSDFEKDLIMFMTVTTSENALLTSHMGISKTTSAELREKSSSVEKENLKGLSIPLHSFAAQVTLQHYTKTKKRLMITAPLPVMLNILFKSLPHDALFVGARAPTLQEFKKYVHKERGYLIREANEEAQEDLERIVKDLNRELDNRARQESSRDRDAIAQEILGQSYKEDTMRKPKIKYENGTLQLGEHAIFLEALANKYFLENTYYKYYLYGPTPRNDMQKESPPLLSFQKDSFGVLDFRGYRLYKPERPSEKWFDIHEGNRDYAWLFTTMFWSDSTVAATGGYVLVDLEALSHQPFEPHPHRPS